MKVLLHCLLLSYTALKKLEVILIILLGLFFLCALVWFFLFLALDTFSVGPFNMEIHVFLKFLP